MRTEQAEFWEIYKQDEDGSWVLIDFDRTSNDNIPSWIRVLAHNCRFKFGTSGFLDLETAMSAAINISKLSWYLGKKFKVVHVIRVNQVQLVPLENKATTECIISNDPQ